MARPTSRAGAKAGSARAARKPPGRLWRYRRLWFLLATVGLTALAGAFWVVTQVPLPSAVPQAETTRVFDAAGGQLASIHGSENRIVVSLEAVPKVVQDAVVAAEDRNFFTHKGVDPIGILRATLVDVRRRGPTQGGSTITQQYVKNVYVGSEPTLWRKIREAMIAIKLERTRTKPEILERYLNTVYFGRGAYGIQAASRAYFDKDVSQLGLREAAYLAGIIRSPSSSDATTDPARASDLRAIVLDAMVRESAISPAQSAEVKAMALRDYVTAKAPTGSTVSLPGAGAEYFVEYVRQELVRRYNYSEERVLRGGLQVHTSLDPALQRAAYAAIYDQRTGLLNGRNDPAGALVSLDTAGRVVAIVGFRSESELRATGADFFNVRWCRNLGRLTRWQERVDLEAAGCGGTIAVGDSDGDVVHLVWIYRSPARDVPHIWIGEYHRAVA
ncbi:MAG: transglycosylase domain-containing protein [Acidimicrobiales bacterium]